MLLHHLEQWSDEHGLSRLQLVAIAQHSIFTLGTVGMRPV